MPLDTGKQIRIASDNLLKAGYNSISASSENTVKPLTNISDTVNINFRNRVFEFAGRFTIDSTNNKIYINDGADKTITLTSGEYTTPELLADHIETQLNASSSGFTCNYDRDEDKFYIQRSTGWTLRLSQTANATWETIGYTGNLDVVVSGLSSEFADEIRCHWPNEFIKVDFGQQSAIGFLAMIPPSTGVWGVSSDGEIRIQANTIDDFTSPPLDVVVDSNNFGVFKFFDDADYDYRYWKVIFTDPTNSGGPGFVSIGNLFLGQYETFYNTTSGKTHYNAQGARHILVDPTETQVAASGVKYFNRKTKFREYRGISIEYADPDAKQVLYDLIFDKGIYEPYYISVDPKLLISSELSDFTFFCRTKESPDFQHVRKNNYSMTFDVEEVV